MTPPASWGITDLADRWQVTKPGADAVTKRWEQNPGPGVPVVRRLNREKVKYVEQAEVEAWEASELLAGRPLPGSSNGQGPGRPVGSTDRVPRIRRSAGSSSEDSGESADS